MVSRALHVCVREREMREDTGDGAPPLTVSLPLSLTGFLPFVRPMPLAHLCAFLVLFAGSISSYLVFGWYFFFFLYHIRHLTSDRHRIPTDTAETADTDLTTTSFQLTNSSQPSIYSSRLSTINSSYTLPSPSLWCTVRSL